MKQGVKGLQAFIFCIVNVNDKHTTPRLKTHMCGKSPGLKVTSIFVILLIRMALKATIQKQVPDNTSLSQFETCPEVYCETLDSYFQSNY